MLFPPGKSAMLAPRIIEDRGFSDFFGYIHCDSHMCLYIYLCLPWSSWSRVKRSVLPQVFPLCSIILNLRMHVSGPAGNILSGDLLLTSRSWHLELNPYPELRGALAKTCLFLCTTLHPSWLHHEKLRLRTFAASGWRISLGLLEVLSLQNLDASSTIHSHSLSKGSDLCILWGSGANPASSVSSSFGRT